MPISQIVTNSIANDAVVTADIANAAVTPAKLSTGAPSWNSSGVFSFNSGYGSVGTAFACRAWVNFDGTGSITIRGSGNVSSITDIGVGLYSVNFATALPDGNYSAFAQADTSGNNTIARPHPQLAYNSGFYYIVVQNTANSVIDSNFVFSAVFR